MAFRSRLPVVHALRRLRACHPVLVMAILVQCPVCAHTLEARDEIAGKGCACPACRAVISVPLRESKPPPLPAPSSRACVCPTCGRSLTITRELEGVLVTCPFCRLDFRTGSDHRAFPQPRRRPRFQCPHCGTSERPVQTTRISPAGWVIFAVFLVFFFPLFWVGLLITERQMYCYDYGRRV